MLERLLLQPETTAQRTGNAGGGGVLDQSVFSRPAEVSWKATVPMLVGALDALPCSSVVHARVKAGPLCSLTVTFSFVGVVL